MTDDKQTEVQEEVQERLEVLELRRTARPEKLAREGRLLEGATEVRYAERAFRPQHASSIDDVRRGVDALAPPARRALPEVPPLPEPPAPPAPPPKAVSDAHRAALAPRVKGKLLSAETVYRTDAGEAVEATWETPSGPRSGTFILKDGEAREVDDIAARIDALPAPSRPPAPTQAAPAPAPAAAEEPKKRRFGLPGRKPKEAPAPEPQGEPSSTDEPKKRRFGLRRK